MTDYIGPSSSHPASTSPQEKWNYAEAVAEVETIIARIETGELELEEVFDQFEQAVEHLRQCETFLQRKQQQMGLLIETLREEG
ncbi:MAG: exodeoxyribonuclease VII small subunit [Chroococcidiopsidaceae cyanobacterium CP_BM_ER_R8_30]|nr:exodeoxyribonuclease VII small subunit [Chroococcidiopsidaceae cyanobacterium CP_BM_ER_R8_30]